MALISKCGIIPLAFSEMGRYTAQITGKRIIWLQEECPAICLARLVRPHSTFVTNNNVLIKLSDLRGNTATTADSERTIVAILCIRPAVHLVVCRFLALDITGKGGGCFVIACFVCHIQWEWPLLCRSFFRPPTRFRWTTLRGCIRFVFGRPSSLPLHSSCRR